MTVQVDIAAERHPLHGTILARRRLRWPFVLTTPLRLDSGPADMLTVMLQSSSGAIVAGDRLGWRIAAGAGAALHVTTQAATAVHAMPPDASAEDAFFLSAAAGSLVEILPEPLILFPTASLRRRSTLVVDAGARVLLADAFLAHDPAGTARPFRLLAWETEARRPDGTLLFVDRAEVDGAWLTGAALSAHASLLLLAEVPADLAADLDAALAPIAGLYAGASALPGAAGLGIRLAASGGRALRAGMLAAWTVIRTALTGQAPGARRGKSAA